MSSFSPSSSVAYASPVLVAASRALENQRSLFEVGVGRRPLEDAAYLSEQLVTYIGNKRALLPFIGRGLDIVKERVGKTLLDTFDVFSGSGVVSRFLKSHSRSLAVCDLEQYAAIVGACYLSNRSEVDVARVHYWIDRMNIEAESHPKCGIISELYAPEDDENIRAGERVFYTRRNAQFIDTARFVIDEAPPELRPHLLAPLIYVASVHANTSGVFKGFYKNSKTGVGQFGGNGRDALTRICKAFTVPYPVYGSYECDYSVFLGDANALARQHPRVDVAYLDPPYNQHPYGSNYFMLNLIVENERPCDVSEVSGIPKGWKRSAYNQRQSSALTLFDLASSLKARFLLVSFNSEGFIAREKMMEMLGQLGKVEVLETSYNTFRGSRNLGNRDLYVTEYLFLVDKEC